MQEAKTSREIMAEIKTLHDSLLRVEFGVSYLDDALLGMFPGDVTLVGARTGGGKTEFATQVLMHQQSGDRAKSVLYFAMDHEPGEIETRILWRLITQYLNENRPPGFEHLYLRYADWRAGKYIGVLDELERSYRTYVDHLLRTSETKFIYRKAMTANEIADIISAPSFAHEFNLAIIDHFHCLKKSGANAFESQGDAIRLISEAAQTSGRPVLLLGQFKKRSVMNRSPIPDMEEFSGHSDLLYVPQNIIVFGPKIKEGLDKWETYFQIVKARTASDTKAFVGIHGFDTQTKSYSVKYQVGRFLPYSDPQELMGREIPRWAKRAVGTINPSTLKKSSTEFLRG